MKRALPLGLICLCATLAASACKASRTSRAELSGATASAPLAASAAETDHDVRFVTASELRDALQKGEAVLLDVRTDPQFQAGHIKGAKLLPYGEVAARLDELPKDKLIVTYCACPADHLSIKVALDLKHKGFANSGALRGGLKQWIKEGLPTESASTK